MAYRQEKGGVRASVLRRRKGLRRLEESIVREAPVPLVALEPSRLLLVHEPTPFRAALEAGLGREGFEVRSASDAKGALDRLEDPAPFDLALVDMDLYAPWSSRLIAALKTADPGLSVAMLRGEGAREEFAEGYAAGGMFLLGMPGSVRELAEQLRRRLPEARRNRAERREPRKPRFRGWGWAAASVVAGLLVAAAANALLPDSRAAEDPFLDYLRSESARELDARRFQRWSVLEQFRLTQESSYYGRLRAGGSP